MQQDHHILVTLMQLVGGQLTYREYGDDVLVLACQRLNHKTQKRRGDRSISSQALYITTATPSPGWGPRGQGPSKNRQGPGKNNWTSQTELAMQ